MSEQDNFPEESQQHEVAQVSNEYKTKEKHPPLPWSPYWVVRLSTVTIIPLLAGFILAWNWRRFGKSEWVLPTLLTYLVLLIPLLFCWYLVVQDSPPPMIDPDLYKLILWGIFAFILSLNAGFLILIGANKQGKAYHVLQTSGYRAMLDYDYRWKFAFPKPTIPLITLIVLIVGIVAYFFQPKTFDNEAMHLSYAFSWIVSKTDNIEQCRASDMHCHLLIHADNEDRIALLFATINLDEAFQDSQALGNYMWTNWFPSLDVHLIDHGVYTIAGLDAHYIHYTAPDSGHYFMEIVVDLDHAYFDITISARSQASMDRRWREIENVLQGLTLK